MRPFFPEYIVLQDLETNHWGRIDEDAFRRLGSAVGRDRKDRKLGFELLRRVVHDSKGNASALKYCFAPLHKTTREESEQVEKKEKIKQEIRTLMEGHAPPHWHEAAKVLQRWWRYCRRDASSGVMPARPDPMGKGRLLSKFFETVRVQRRDFHTLAEIDGHAFHVVPEAIEWVDGVARGRVCSKCHASWKAERGDSVLRERKETRRVRLRRLWRGVARATGALIMLQRRQWKGVDPARKLCLSRRWRGAMRAIGILLVWHRCVKRARVLRQRQQWKGVDAVRMLHVRRLVRGFTRMVDFWARLLREVRSRDAPEYLFDDLYWSGAPVNTIAHGEDFGRLSRLRELGVDVNFSVLEKLVLAEVRCHYVTYKVVAYDHVTLKSRLQGHAICFSHEPQRIYTLAQNLEIDVPHVLNDEKTWRLRGKVMRWVAEVCSRPVEKVKAHMSPAQTSVTLLVEFREDEKDDLGDAMEKLSAGSVSLISEVGEMGVTLRHFGEAHVSRCNGSLSETVLWAAIDAARIQFVGPKGVQTRLERCALNLSREGGDLQLRPHVVYNCLKMRYELHDEGERPPSIQRVRDIINAFDARSKIAAHAIRTEDMQVERLMEHEDIANVRSVAQSHETRKSLLDDDDKSGGAERDITITHHGVFEAPVDEEGAYIKALSATFDAAREDAARAKIFDLVRSRRLS